MSNSVVFSLLALSLVFLRVVDGGTVSCSQTPYPEVCNHSIDTTFLANLDESKKTFRDMAFRATVDQAMRAYQLVSAMDLSPFDERAQSAWTDCLELHEDTIDLLNRTLTTNNPSDHLTWLSASIFNQQTCRDGFENFGLSSHLQSFPLMLSNFSKLLSNSLAIAKMTSSPVGFGGGNRRRLMSEGFPEWLSSADRKLLQSSSASPKANVIVAQDGSGNYKTINEALAAASGKGYRFIIHVKSGVYNENVEIKGTMKNIMIVGDGVGSTIVTGSKNVQDGTTTFRSATFGVSGDGFIAQDITFRNTAGPQKHQAVALRSGADHSVFYRCSFEGYQDTLFVYSQRQFYRDCDIYGTEDFIFGDAVAVLQNCNIYLRKPMSGQKNTVTAQGRTDPNENTGIIIHNSRITASGDLRPVQGSYKTYLGRPWQKYSRTVVMKSGLDGLIDPAGWMPWSGNFGLSTLYYAEFMNSGAGASTGGRVKWPGYHVITSATEASKFTVGNFLAGGSWIPGTGVPFTAGL